MSKEIFVPQSLKLSSIFDTPAEVGVLSPEQEWVARVQKEVSWVSFDDLVEGKPQVPSSEALLHALVVADEILNTD